MLTLSLALVICAVLSSLGTSRPLLTPQQLTSLTLTQRQLSTTSSINTTDVTASTFSESNPVHTSLFGPLRQMVAAPSELEPYKHPRIVVGPIQWDDLLSMYADPQNFNTDGTWSKFFRGVSQNAGPSSQFLLDLAELETTNGTLAYDGRPYQHNSSEYQAYRNGLVDLANRIVTSSSGNADTFPICALWGSVALKQQSLGITPFIDMNTVHTCIKAAVAWSKIVLAHRTYHCNPTCPTSGPNYANLWNTQQKFSLHHNWYLGGTGIGITYDLLYDYISPEDRVPMRSAIALFVMNRYSWGSSETSTRSSPNALVHPHRIFSNWAGYNSNLYLANLAIEGEEGFDNYTTAVLLENNASGFNQGLHDRYSALLEQFMLHSFYPDGSSFEDGYSYFIALREGSLGLVASHRRGSNILGSPRFRNIIHNAAQMHEPWYCGSLIGHASGGGILYNAYVGLFRYAFPQGELPGMLWRQRFGVYKNNQPCRIYWSQSNLQLAFLGGEHSSAAEAPQNIDPILKPHFKLSYYATRRGLLVARSSLSENASYIHFDARPDSFFLGHDNADRGVFTFTALRQTWFDDLQWADNLDSRKHSLLHIDGLAQDMKSTSVKMLKVHDNGQVVLAAADLTYAYNVQWARNHSHDTPPTRDVTTYVNGVASNIPTLFPDRETSDPWSLGWPVDDRAQDIGFSDNMKLNGEENIAFEGVWMWKRAYRTFPRLPLSHMVRSMVLVRSSNNEVGYGVMVDSVSAGEGMHVFESYLILHPSVSVEDNMSQCNSNTCKIVLSAGGEAKLDIHVIALGNDLSYTTETFDGTKNRLIVNSTHADHEEIWLILHPHQGNPANLAATRTAEGHSVIVYEGEERRFATNSVDHTVEELLNQPQVSPSPSGSISPTPSTSSSPTASGSVSPTPSKSVSPTPSSSTSPTSSSSSSPVSSPSASTSAAPSVSMSPSASNSPSPSQAGTPPMTPIALTGKLVVADSDMTSEQAQFFHDTSAPYQVVFEFTSRSSSSLQLEDRFRTCYSATKVRTSLQIFDCGDEGEASSNYQARQCTVVENDVVVRSCRSFRTKMWATLVQGKKYYLVASITPVKSPTVLTIQHKAVSL